MAPWRLFSAAAVSIPLVAAAVIGTADERPRAREAAPAASATTLARGKSALSALPTAFEASGRGFRARGAGYQIILGQGETTVVLQRGTHGRAVRLRSKLIGARRVSPTSESRLPGVVNIYRGASRRERIPTYRRVRYPSVYPGIDAVYHGRQSALEYDFEVQPGARPSQIALSHSGARSLSIAGNGDLLLHVRGGVLRERRPVAYQVIGGRRVPVDVSYTLADDRVGFDVGSYDRTRELVIDPVLSYSSYLGGSDQDYLTKIAIGSDRSIYITGRTLSNDFPGGSRDNARTDLDAFVTKLGPDASPIYTSYVGSTGLDQAFDVTADSSGRAYIVGNTSSTNFAPFQLDSCEDGVEDGFIVRLNTDGSLSYRSCLGGDGLDTATGIAVREVGGTPEAYIAGDMTQPFGTYPSSGVNGFGTTCCTGGLGAFFAKVSFGSSVSIPYLTYVDGSSTDNGRAVAVDASGNAYVAGRSVSTSIGGTTKPPGASAGVFVVKVNPATTGAGSKIYSTWIDGSSSEDVGSPDSPPYVPGSIAVSSGGVAYVAGSTGSADLPAKVTHDSFKYVSGDAGYISVLSANGSVARTIYVDGTGATHLADLALQEIGGVTSVYAIGDTDGTISGFNTLSGQSCADTSAFHPDAFLLKLVDGATPQGIYLTCLGGGGDDTGTAIAAGPGSDATAWIIGTTTGSFPTVQAKQPNANAVTDGFVARVSQHAATISAGPDASIATRTASFSFSTSGSGLTFACSVLQAGKLVRGGPLGPCPSGSAGYSDLADGEHTFEVATVDGAGAQSARASRTFTVDTASPTAAYTIAPNPVLSGRTASFDASSSRPASEAIVRYEWDLDGDGQFETDGGGNPTTTKTYTTAGTVNTALRVTDAAGGSDVEGIALVVTDPSSLGNRVGVSINKGAQYTNKPTVTLTITAPSGTTALLVSNDGGFVGAIPQAVKTDVEWKLDSSGPERLPKTVYVRFLTGPISSPNYTDDIILDERPPTVSTAAIAGAASASGTTATVAKAKKYTIKVKAKDTNSGVAGIQVTASKKKPGKLLKYKTKLKVKAKKRPKFLRAKDRAGNYSAWKKLR